MKSSTVGVDLQPKIIAQEHARDVAASTLNLKQWTRIFMKKKARFHHVIVVSLRHPSKNVPFLALKNNDTERPFGLVRENDDIFHIAIRYPCCSWL